MNVGFLGCGNIAQAMIAGLLDGGIKPASITVLTRNQKKKKFYEKKSIKRLDVGNSNSAKFDFIFLCVKPADVKDAIEGSAINWGNTTLVSVVAGISSQKLEVFSNSKKVIRIMPTTSAVFRKSITAIFMAEKQKKQIKKLIPLLNKMGSTIELSSENDLHEFTSVVGSGQAFIMEALKQYDKKILKFSKNRSSASRNLALFVSSIAQHIELNNGIEPSIKKIMSPKGTTYSGLKALKKNKISSVFKSAFKAAEKRSKEIQNEY